MERKNKPFKIGVILSIIAGIIILFFGISMYTTPTDVYLQTLQEQYPEMTAEELDLIVASYPTLGITFIVMSILILVGAFLGYKDRNKIGGILVIIFSILPSFSLIGIPGVIGGILLYFNR
ncbi:MAG: DUF4064 domain-containing protein [Candidatus Methanoliparum thermophilum]|uniref:DUF4064 domain-containing protein n=1 Tax=Methanoliparum thermophilum TaxID=2491083 RepID=A0A520KSY8_METT2|nr:MAG: DUF4064 domain-containing protein [Candidatus Methanoliparum thermophilum]